MYIRISFAIHQIYKVFRHYKHSSDLVHLLLACIMVAFMALVIEGVDGLLLLPLIRMVTFLDQWVLLWALTAFLKVIFLKPQMSLYAQAGFFTTMICHSFYNTFLAMNE